MFVSAIMFLDVLSQCDVHDDDPGVRQELTTFRWRCMDLLVCILGLAASAFLERHMLLSQVMRFALGPPLGCAFVCPCYTYVCIHTCIYGHKLEKEMATHSSILAWRNLWTEEPGGLLSMGSHRVGHDWSNLACMYALEKKMATHSSVLAWRIPGTEKPGGLPSMGSHRVGHDWSDLAAAAASAWLQWLGWDGMPRGKEEDGEEIRGIALGQASCRGGWQITGQ